MDPLKEFSSHTFPDITGTKVLAERLQTFSLPIRSLNTKFTSKQQLVQETTSQLMKDDTKTIQQDQPMPKDSSQLARNNNEAKKSEFRSVPLNHKQYRRILKRRATKKSLQIKQRWSASDRLSRSQLFRISKKFERMKESMSREREKKDWRGSVQDENEKQTEFEAGLEGMKGGKLRTRIASERT